MALRVLCAPALGTQGQPGVPRELQVPEHQLCPQAGAVGAPLVPGWGARLCPAPASQILVPAGQQCAKSIPHVL